MGAFVDLTGQKFGRLTVLQCAGRDNVGRALWQCRCQCDGRVVIVASYSLRSGNSRSCGCLMREVNSTHGLTYHELYPTWLGIKQRCENPNNTRYSYYGGSGISIYPPWRDSFPLFLNYVLEHIGERPEGMTIDRIDNDGNYEPGNLRWATQEQQNWNQRRPSRNRNNTTGVIGVIFTDKKYRVSIRAGGTRYNLGRFSSKAKAVRVRRQAEAILERNGRTKAAARSQGAILESHATP